LNAIVLGKFDGGKIRRLKSGQKRPFGARHKTTFEMAFRPDRILPWEWGIGFLGTKDGTGRPGNRAGRRTQVWYVCGKKRGQFVQFQKKKPRVGSTVKKKFWPVVGRGPASSTMVSARKVGEYWEWRHSPPRIVGGKGAKTGKSEGRA